MKRILHIVSTMNCGGIETFIMNLYRNIDRSKIQFDFVVNTTQECFYDNEINKLGGKIFSVCQKKEGIIKNFLQVKKIVKENKYDIVHRHGSNALMALDLLAAKMGGASTRIAHGHNVKASGFSKAHKFFKPLLPKLASHGFACSDAAGEHLFCNMKFNVINNAIDSKKFKYDAMVRKCVREELQIEDDKFLIGNIARFYPQKNHKFLIEVFAKIHQINEKAVLVLLGEGDLKNEIEEQVKEKGLVNSVEFLGIRSDVNRLFQAFDLFLFPSIYEGLGIVLIEAQAAGVPCLTSDKVVPKAVKITDLLEFVSLESNTDIWAEKALEFIDFFEDRKDTSNQILKAGYDVRGNTESLKEFYNAR